MTAAAAAHIHSVLSVRWVVNLRSSKILPLPRTVYSVRTFNVRRLVKAILKPSYSEPPLGA